MEISIKYNAVCKLLWEYVPVSLLRQEKCSKIIDIIDNSFGLKLNEDATKKIENFLVAYERKMKELNYNKTKFQKQSEQWLKTEIVTQIGMKQLGRPNKLYEELQPRQEDLIENHSFGLIKDAFRSALTKNKPKEVGKIVDALPKASPKRIQRMVESIPTPKSKTDFTNEDALALILNLGLTRNKYEILRKAMTEKKWGNLPSTKSLKATKDVILPSVSNVSSTGATIELCSLLENTASRIISTFSKEDISKCHKSELVLICKWGYDGTTGFSEYRQQSEDNISFSSIFMSTLVPLRMRLYTNSSSSSTVPAFEDVWINRTPASKLLCRPIKFEYMKENRDETQNIVVTISEEIRNLPSIAIKISDCIINVTFDLQLTMIDGKVANALTDTKSYWKCNICGKKSSEFEDKSDETIKEEALKFGISPLHARIRFMEYCLHLSYDIKYRNIKGNETVSSRNNKDLANTRRTEKKRIQDEFRKHELIIDKPINGYGSSNNGNTARRFFEDPETTSLITGLDKKLIRNFKIILATINSKKQINAEKFDAFANETKVLIKNLYPWRLMTPTVHKVLIISWKRNH